MESFTSQEIIKILFNAMHIIADQPVYTYSVGAWIFKRQTKAVSPKKTKTFANQVYGRVQRIINENDIKTTPREQTVINSLLDYLDIIGKAGTYAFDWGFFETEFICDPKETVEIAEKCIRRFKKYDSV